MSRHRSATRSRPRVRIYISIYKKYGKAAFGICIKWFGHEVFAAGWFGNQKPYAQMIALDCALSAIEQSDIDVQVEAIFRTEYIKHRLGMATSRKIAKQHGISSRPMVEDEDRWQHVALRAIEAGVKVNMALSEAEQKELNVIDRKLDDLFFEDREFRFSLRPIEPAIILPEMPLDGDELKAPIRNPPAHDHR